jgi:esterase/lipase superfamily enzyme
MLSQPPEASRPLAAEAAPALVGTEPSAPSEAAVVASAVAPAPIADDHGDFQAVTVFYGTDRNSIVTSRPPPPPHLMWLYLAGVCGLLCGLFAVVAGLSSRKRLLGGLAVMSFSACALTAVMGTIAWLQSDGAVAGPNLSYGNDRGEFVMGTCEVSIPRNHQVAELEAPSVFKLDFVEDPRKHVVLLDIKEEQPDVFFSKLRSRVDRSVRQEAFVFVHGFNVTFEDAARRTAQLSYDLKFQGAPIFYSWPSQGGLFQYTVDETNVVWTVPHLREFLKEIARQSGAESVHLVAHSMGNRALTIALRELSIEMRGQPPMFHEVVLTAPDIDADVFRRDIAPAITTTAKRVTLYASSNDEALVLSKKVHGYPRAGDTGDGLVVLPGIETVDVSAVDTSLLGHNYYGDNATVISDMIDLVRNSKSAGERSWLEAARLEDLLYWVFRPDRGVVGAAPSGTPSRY